MKQEKSVSVINDGLNLKEKQIHSFLMIGQSNMAGRGDFGEVSSINNPNCYMLRMGRWQPMSEPINPDRAILDGEFHSGISLGASFADEIARATGEKVGLIPCADGGTMIDQWMPGEVLYDHAVMMARLAIRNSRLSGIIWHQGESDCGTEELARLHKAKFEKLVSSIRRDLGNENLPFITGELSKKISERWCVGNRPEIINFQYHALESELSCYKVVSADGLKLKPDGIHFDSSSLRLFGRRYAEAYLDLINSN